MIIVAGPTASGKSSLAADIAANVGGVILNADSMQVYQGIPIITACPSEQELKKAEHRLFEIYPPSFRGNVVDWLERVVCEIKKLWIENKIPVIVGGTGLYIDNLINGTTPIPETSIKTRQKVQQMLDDEGCLALYQKLQEIDLPIAQKLNANDKTRIVRALEVFYDTGIKLSEWYKKPMLKKLPEASFFVIKLCPSTTELDNRCYVRLDNMIKDGALHEIENLNNLKLDVSLPAMKALGVPELLQYVQGKCSLVEALDMAKLHTRQYAKRQRTWFRNKLKADLEINSCYHGDFSPVIQALRKNNIISE